MIGISIGITSGNNLAQLKQALFTPVSLDVVNFSHASSALLMDFEGVIKNSLVDEIRFEGVRRVENLVANSEQPSTQNITVKIGHDYQARIGSKSDNGATVVFSEAFTGTLMADGVNSISFPNGTPQTAISTTLAATVTGNIKNFQVEDVTGQTDKNPSEFTLPQWQNKLEFDGVDDYIEIPHSIESQSFSYSGSFTFNSLGVNVLIGKSGGSGQSDDKATLLYLNTFLVLIINSSLQAQYVFTPKIGMRYHIAATYDDTTKLNQLWLDGVKVDERVYAGTLTHNPGTYYTIGADYDGTTPNTYPNAFFDGILENIAIFDRVLNEIEVSELKNGGKITNGLVGNWKLNETEGQIVYDTSLNGYYGTLRGFDLFPEYRETENGNTVDGNGTVIVATGSPIPDNRQKGILIEKQTYNLQQKSELFNTWSTLSGVTVTANNTNFPNGEQAADKIIATSVTSVHYLVDANYTLINGENYTYSIFAKAGGYNYLQITSSSGFPTDHVNFDLTSGIIAGGVTTAAKIKNYGNGWYRCSFTCTANGTNGSFAVVVSNSGTLERLESWMGDDVNGIFLFGAMAEQGSFSTSYIETENSTITRAADNLSYEVGGGTFPQNFSLLVEVTPIAEGTDYDNAEFRLFSTGDSRGTANQIRTIGDTAYNFDGTTFYLDKSDFSKNVRTKLCFSCKQEGSNIKVIVVKDGTEKLNIIVAGILDHSNLGILNIGRFGNDHFSGNFRNIQLYFIPFNLNELKDIQTDFFVDEDNNSFVDELRNQITTIL